MEYFVNLDFESVEVSREEYEEFSAVKEALAAMERRHDEILQRLVDRARSRAKADAADEGNFPAFVKASR